MGRIGIAVLLALCGATGCSESTRPAGNTPVNHHPDPPATTPAPSGPNPTAPVVADSGNPERTGKPTRPNILVIVADDLGYHDIGVHGGRDVPTPHIDALAAVGVRCTSGYVSAPYCSPSRAGFLTGRYPTRFGHEFNPHEGDPAQLGLPLDQRTIADRLRAAGYATGLVGKWHQGFDRAHHPQARGFDDYFGFLVGGHNYLLARDAEAEFGSAYSRRAVSEVTLSGRVMVSRCCQTGRSTSGVERQRCDLRSKT